jgi:hypothetical protein
MLAHMRVNDRTHASQRSHTCVSTIAHMRVNSGYFHISCAIRHHHGIHIYVFTYTHTYSIRGTAVPQIAGHVDACVQATFACMCMRLRISACVYVQIHKYFCVCICILYIYIYIYIYPYIYIYGYMCVCACMHECLYAHAYTRTMQASHYEIGCMCITAWHVHYLQRNDHAPCRI